MNNIFQKTSAHWARYSEYEYRRGEDGNLYIMPSPTAKPSVYDPLANAEAMVVDALNIGRLAMRHAGEKQLRSVVMDFVSEYGLFGFMTALPTTADFAVYDAVYLPKNHFIREETMTTKDYLSIYFPFNKPDFYKDARTTEWRVNQNPQDKGQAELALTFSDEPLALNMSLQRDYAERYDWIVTQCQDLAFTLVASNLYYEDRDTADSTTLANYRFGIEAFGGIAPTYRIGMYRDGPTIIWDFHSLLRGVQMMFSFALTDGTKPLRVCPQCGLAFIAPHPNSTFCSAKCKNQHNVYKNREKKKRDTDD